MYDVIKLNVGGQEFVTTRDTLTSCPGSRLSMVFDLNSTWSLAYCGNGVYFLDSDPKYFSIILNWLRHRQDQMYSLIIILFNFFVTYRELIIDQYQEVYFENILKIAKYFNLQDLCELIKKELHWSPGSL